MHDASRDAPPAPVRGMRASAIGNAVRESLPLKSSDNLACGLSFRRCASARHHCLPSFTTLSCSSPRHSSASMQLAIAAASHNGGHS